MTSAVHEAGREPRARFHRVDVGVHRGEELLHHAEARDRVAELDPLLGVVQGAGAGQLRLADAARREAEVSAAGEQADDRFDRQQRLLPYAELLPKCYRGRNSRLGETDHG